VGEGENDVFAALGLRVRQLREGRAAQRDVALRIGISQSHLAKIERGFGNPTLGVLHALAGVLGISLRDLVAPLPESTSEGLVEYEPLPQHIAAAARQVAALPPVTRKRTLESLQALLRVARAAAAESGDPAFEEPRVARSKTPRGSRQRRR